MAADQQDFEKKEFKASHIRTPITDVVGGKIHLTESELKFEPNNIAESGGENKLQIPLYEIRDIRKESAGRGIIYSLTNGWLAGHLHIKLRDGTEHVFTVSSVTKKIEMLSLLIDSATEPESDIDEPKGGDEARSTIQYCSSCGEEVSASMEYCPDCGTGLGEKETTQERTSEDKTDSSARFPILSIFSAIILLRGGALVLEGTGSVSTSSLFFALGVLIIPRVRLFTHKKILSKSGINLAKRLWSAAIALIYILFVTISSLFLIGDGGFIGLATIIMVLVISAIIVLISRVVS